MVLLVVWLLYRLKLKVEIILVVLHHHRLPPHRDLSFGQPQILPGPEAGMDSILLPHQQHELILAEFYQFGYHSSKNLMRSLISNRLNFQMVMFTHVISFSQRII